MNNDTDVRGDRLHMCADLLTKLKDAQQRHGYVPEEWMRQTAALMQLPISHIYGVASFYAFLSTRPLGTYVIRICKSIPCYLKNGEMMIDSVARIIGIRPGETTADGKFSFELTHCIGACDAAPAMMLNEQIYGHLTTEKIAEILRACK